MIYDLVIIGGGAAGLTCGNIAYKKGLKFVILEAYQKPAKKVLASGNGKCNLSNINAASQYYNSTFAEPVINKFPPEKIIDFFNSLGMKTKIVQDRVYPYTESSKTVVEFLTENIKDNIICDYKVDKIEKKDGLFIINEKIKAKNTLLATGSNATLGFDSNNLIRAFGHKSKQFLPSLVYLFTDTKYIKSFSGIRVKGKAALIKKDKIIAEETGEILFKDKGISGIAIFSLSAFIARNPKDNFIISLDFANGITLKELKKYPLEGIVQSKVARSVEKQAKARGITGYQCLKDFRLNVKELGSIKNAQVCTGGLLTEDFNPETLESKLVSGLYAAGEALNVDGECGGFNLQWAWASGMQVGTCEIKKKK